ncbi:MAG: hypothetical protein K2O04_07195 [Clostridiales bacterium]|nr:hypothetical protein [Clostridiales bacterium]
MSNSILKKYAYLYAELDGIRNVGSAYTSVLLSGEDDEGLKVLSRIVAARLCGISIDRAFDEHADIIVYPRAQEEKKSKSKSGGEKSKRYAISVEDIKEILDSLYLTPFQLKNKVYIIENAESMSEICQNKLLKSLEEPPPRVCFVLCSSGKLLPTVESRCNRIELPPFDVSVVERELSKFHNDAAAVKLAAQASRGNPGLAERILADAGFADTYAASKKLIKLSTGSKMFAHAAAVYEKLSRDKVDALLGVVEYLLNDIARLCIGADTVFDRKDIEEIAGGYTPYSAALAAEAVREAKKHNAANCMPQAVMDTLILKIMEVKAQCQR